MQALERERPFSQLPHAPGLTLKGEQPGSAAAAVGKNDEVSNDFSEGESVDGFVVDADDEDDASVPQAAPRLATDSCRSAATSRGQLPKAATRKPAAKPCSTAKRRRKGDVPPSQTQTTAKPTSPPSAADAEGAKARREAVRQKLLEALGGDTQASKQLATEIEAALFKELQSSPGYKHQARSLISNLRSCAEFRAALVAGAFPVSALPHLSTEAMASSQLKAERLQVRKAAMEACEADWHLRREPADALRGQFTCGKCQGNRTWYFQFQTRACDEPMEVFVMCRDCCHGWRHNDESPDDIFRQVWKA
eukprot:TRINITY_DN11386_c0_g1_i1.p1 TRINITY_DN11386_c0_g1~~TRINITY_DN11386_c0_g1_i1.p1  ORF type:complete len:325 (-),score=84.06 TRINITY_DN11386_c0_g1_i1:195-1118(-)